MKRLILLAISVTGFGAAAVAAGFAQTPSTSSGIFEGAVTGGGTAEAVCTPEGNLAISFLQTDESIPSDGLYYPVADILVNDTDEACDYSLVQLEVTDNGTATQTCPTPAGPTAQAVIAPWDYALDPADVENGDLLTGTPLPLDVTTVDQDTGVDLTLRIDEFGEGCTYIVSGGTVEASFEEQETGAPVVGEPAVSQPGVTTNTTKPATNGSSTNKSR